jgi:arylformamidase
MQRWSSCLVLLCALISNAWGETVQKDIPYAQPTQERQFLDIYAPDNAKDLPVVFWIHGGGWQAGDKSSIQSKPQWFLQQGFVFVSTNYRLLPNVTMETIVEDVAKSLGWVHKNISRYGGDPNKIYVMGHSAGAQLAALICTDDRYLKSEGVPFSSLKGCVPVDGDTYDIPAIIETAETRRRVHKQPQAKFGHREKFGNDPSKHVNFSAVTHAKKDKGIPPFLIMYVASHPDNTAQAQRLDSSLREAGVGSKLYGAKDSEHSKINNDIGTPNDPGSSAILEFVGKK